jgi:hypothetical protein
MFSALSPIDYVTFESKSLGGGWPALHAHKRFIGAGRGGNDGCHLTSVIAECTEAVLLAYHKKNASRKYSVRHCFNC